MSDETTQPDEWPSGFTADTAAGLPPHYVHALADEIAAKQLGRSERRESIKRDIKRFELQKADVKSAIEHREFATEHIKLQTAAFEDINRTLIAIEAAILGADTVTTTVTFEDDPPFLAEDEPIG